MPEDQVKVITTKNSAGTFAPKDNDKVKASSAGYVYRRLVPFYLEYLSASGK